MKKTNKNDNKNKVMNYYLHDITSKYFISVYNIINVQA